MIAAACPPDNFDAVMSERGRAFPDEDEAAIAYKSH